MRRAPRLAFAHCLLLGGAALLHACGDSSSDPSPSSDPPTPPPSRGGVVQKGPFLRGAEITISALTPTLSATGRVERRTILDDFGRFEAPADLALAELTVTGRFFNEVTGELSPSELTLGALVDLSTGSAPNINLLTTLARKRIRALVAAGAAFDQARRQAEREVPTIFGVLALLDAFSTMDLSAQGVSSAALLLASAALIGSDSIPTVATRMAAIEDDLADNGRLDDPAILNTLFNNQRNLDVPAVSGRLAQRYRDLGFTGTLPDFGALAGTLEDSCVPPSGTVLYSETFDSAAGWTLSAPSAIANGTLRFRDNPGASRVVALPEALGAGCLRDLKVEVSLGAVTHGAGSIVLMLVTHPSGGLIIHLSNTATNDVYVTDVRRMSLFGTTIGSIDTRINGVPTSGLSWFRGWRHTDGLDIVFLATSGTEVEIKDFRVSVP